MNMSVSTQAFGEEVDFVPFAVFILNVSFRFGEPL